MTITIVVINAEPSTETSMDFVLGLVFPNNGPAFVFLNPRVNKTTMLNRTPKESERSVMLAILETEQAAKEAQRRIELLLDGKFKHITSRHALDSLEMEIRRVTNDLVIFITRQPTEEEMLEIEEAFALLEAGLA